MKRHICYVITFLGYCALAAIPGEWLWFDPGAPIFRDAERGQPVTLSYTREIKRNTSIAYTVVVRDAVSLDIVCESQSGPFEYKKAHGPIVDKDLAWWAPGDPRCRALKPGSYWVETQWRIVTPLRAILREFLPDNIATALGWIIPPKAVYRDSPPFTITENTGH